MPNDTQADLRERARAAISELVLQYGFGFHAKNLEDAEKALVKRFQSEHEAAAAEARRLRDALELFLAFGCPACSGDCASANPPVSACPMQEAMELIAATAPPPQRGTL